MHNLIIYMKMDTSQFPYVHTAAVSLLTELSYPSGQFGILKQFPQES